MTDEASSGVRIRRADRNDLPEVLALAESCQDGPHWPHSAWEPLLTANTSTVSHAVLLVARTEGSRLAGWLAGSLVAGVAELEFLLIAPRARGQGWGRRLLDSWLAWLHDRHCSEIFLEVRASNAAALRLYQAAGFEVTGQREAYYRDPVEDALVLRRVLEGEAVAGTLR